MLVPNSPTIRKESHRVNHLEIVRRSGQVFTALLEEGDLLCQVVNLISVEFGYSRACLFFLDKQTNKLVLKAHSGIAENYVWALQTVLNSSLPTLAGFSAATGQTQLRNDLTPEPNSESDELFTTRAELAIPLKTGERVLGVLNVQSDEAGAFSDDDVLALQILADQTSIALENARLFRETRKRYEATIALHETSLDIISQLEMKPLLEALLHRGVPLVGAQAGALFLYNRQENLIYDVANYNTWRDWTGIVLRPGEGVIGHVVLTGEARIVNDYEEWLGKADIFTGGPHPVVMGAPLKWRDQIIGGIVVDNEQETRRFDKDDLWLLSLFADMATIAIKNAEFHTQLKEFSQELEHAVQERTHELVWAKEEIASNAEKLRSLFAKTIHLQEEERARIAREMHDGVIQLISAARYELRAAEVAIGHNSPEKIHSKHAAVRELLGEMEKELRHAIHDLHPPVLDAVGLIPTLQTYATSFQEFSGVNCQFRVSGVLAGRLPPSLEIALYRLVREALNNVAAHSGAKSALVSIEVQSSGVAVTVQDDGRGFDYQRWTHSRDSTHLGLTGMQERIRSLGGEFNLVSSPGHGTQLSFRLPLQLEMQAGQSQALL